MKEEMTITEIESQFESEWVLIENPRTDEALNVLGSEVFFHSKDRDEVYHKAVSLRPKRSAIVYGEIGVKPTHFTLWLIMDCGYLKQDA